jgi:hypothetical protein
VTIAKKHINPDHGIEDHDESDYESDSESIEDQGDPIFYGSDSEELSYLELLALDHYREYDVIDIGDHESVLVKSCRHV